MFCLALTSAQDTPLQPMTVKGDVQLDSQAAPIGTHVLAKLGDEILARDILTTEGSYVLTIPGDESQESAEIRIYVNTIYSGETLEWESAGIVDLDLDVGSTDADDDDSDDASSDGDAPDEGDGPIPILISANPPVDSPPVGDAPTAGEDSEGLPEGGSAEAPEETAGVKMLADVPPAEPAEKNVGDNSIFFILFAVIMAVFLVAFIFKSKISGGKTK